MSDFSAPMILQQLGGRKFMVMTGAKNFVKDDKTKSISFKIPRANGISYVKIMLNGKDLYDIEFYKLHKLEPKLVKKVDDIYADQLQEIFTENTGLYTKLGR